MNFFFKYERKVKSKCIKAFLFFLIAGLFCKTAVAQDSAYRYYPEFTKYALLTDPDSLIMIDTSIGNFHRYNPAEHEFGLVHNGYLGAPETSKLFEPNRSPDINVGFHAFDSYWRSIEDVKFYNTKQPYTSFRYQQGSKSELLVTIDHAQNINKNISLGINFNRMRTDGWYQRQNAKESNFDAFLHFKTNNNRYHGVLAYVLNDLKIEENGGIKNVAVFTDSTLFDKTLADINLDSAKNSWRNDELMMLNVLQFGRKIISGTDSNAVQKIVPKFRIQERFEWENRSFRFYDIENDGFYYAADTLEWKNVRDTFRYNRFFNEFRLTKLNHETSRKLFGWEGSAYFRHQIFLVENNGANENIQSGIIGGEVQFKLKQTLMVLPYIEYNLAGRNAGDYRFGSMVNLQAGKTVSFNVNAYLLNNHPSLVEKEYYSTYYNWSNSFSASKTSAAEFSIVERKWHLILKGKIFSESNYIYWNQQRMPQQLAGNLSGYQLFLKKDFQIKHYHFDNELMYQSYNIDSVVSFPPIVYRGSVYYQSMIFKKAMLGKVGADINYTSGYYMPGYIGETGQFTVQNQLNEKYNPTIDAFVSVRVRGLRAYLVFQNIFNQGSFSAYPYPMPDRAFKFGFEWKFWD